MMFYSQRRQHKGKTCVFDIRLRRTQEMVDQKVGIYWWLKTPKVNLTWPVLRTKECAKSTRVKLLNVQPAILPLMSF